MSMRAATRDGTPTSMGGKDHGIRLGHAISFSKAPVGMEFLEGKQPDDGSNVHECVLLMQSASIGGC